jgi:uncharacterized protein
MALEYPHVLLLFVPWPRPGRVKSRLARQLGPDYAARLARALADQALDHMAPIGEFARRVVFAPEEARPAMQAWLPRETLWPQLGADPGARRSGAQARAFAEGFTRVALASYDVPRLDRDRVLAAFAALAEHDVVLGPSRDGGYYLVATRAPWPGLFEGIPWGTAGVLGETLRRAAALGLRVRTLESLRAVKTTADLRAEWAVLSAEMDDPPFVQWLSRALRRGPGRGPEGDGEA